MWSGTAIGLRWAQRRLTHGSMQPQSCSAGTGWLLFPQCCARRCGASGTTVEVMGLLACTAGPNRKVSILIELASRPRNAVPELEH